MRIRRRARIWAASSFELLLPFGPAAISEQPHGSQAELCRRSAANRLRVRWKVNGGRLWIMVRPTPDAATPAHTDELDWPVPARVAARGGQATNFLLARMQRNRRPARGCFRRLSPRAHEQPEPRARRPCMCAERLEAIPLAGSWRDECGHRERRLTRSERSAPRHT
jgi:hypothetical protein